MFVLNPAGYFTCDLLSGVPWLRHGFGTRLASAWPSSDPLATLRQIHSAKVLTATRPGRQGDGDAVITNTPEVTPSVRTADCVPILLADIRNRAVAAVHAGWRGTSAAIATGAVEALHREFGTRPDDLRVAIGPAIGRCCYQVGPEVASRFEHLFPERDDLHTTTRIDLVEANRRQLLFAGIRERHIATAGMCTCCGTDLFHSYRRDAERSGRMIAAIAICE